MKNIRSSQIASLAAIVCLVGSSVVCGQTATCAPEVRKIVQALNQASLSACRGDFKVQESFQGDVLWEQVSYVVDGRIAFQQRLQGLAGGTVEVTPVRLGGCSGLFLRYAEGAGGSYQNSYLVFSSANGFRCFDLSRSGAGYFSVQDLDGDGEAEIMAQKTEDESAGFPCDKFAYWGRIFHFNRASGRLVEMEGSRYPKYYTTLADSLRSGYENIKNDETVSRRCRQVYLQLISRANKLA